MPQYKVEANEDHTQVQNLKVVADENLPVLSERPRSDTGSPNNTESNRLQHQLLRLQGQIQNYEQDVQAKRRALDFARTPAGRLQARARAQKRLAGLALGAGTQTPYTLAQISETPEEESIRIAGGRLAEAEALLRGAQAEKDKISDELDRISRAAWHKENCIQNAVRPSARVELGQWADEVLPEARLFARLVRCGRQIGDLQSQFPRFSTEVFALLSPTAKKSLFEQARGAGMSVPGLLEIMARVKGLGGETLQDYRKEYRKKAGISRKRARVKHVTQV